MGNRGGLIAMVDLAHQLQKFYSVKVLCVYHSEAVEYIKIHGVEVEVIDSLFYRSFYSLFIHSSASYFSIQNSLKNIYSLCTYFLNMHFFAFKILEKYAKDIDLIYLNSLFLSDWAKAAKKMHIKVIIHVREPLFNGLFSMRKNMIRGNISKYADSIIAVSSDNANRLNILHKTLVVYDPVRDINHPFSNDQFSDDFTYFTYVGGEQRIKGFEQLVNSLDYLDEKVKIFFIGSNLHDTTISVSHGVRCILSSYYRNLSSLKAKMRNSKNVIILGYKEDVFAYYQLSRAVISPFSKPHASLPILEALSIGKPVITSDVDGARELIDDSVGVVYENGNHKALATAINKMALIDDYELQQFKEKTRRKYLDIRAKSNSIKEVIDRCLVV